MLDCQRRAVIDVALSRSQRTSGTSLSVGKSTFEILHLALASADQSFTRRKQMSTNNCDATTSMPNPKGPQCVNSFFSALLVTTRTLALGIYPLTAPQPTSQGDI